MSQPQTTPQGNPELRLDHLAVWVEDMKQGHGVVSKKETAGGGVRREDRKEGVREREPKVDLEDYRRVRADADAAVAGQGQGDEEKTVGQEECHRG